MYKIIIQRENDGEGQEIWRRYDEDFFQDEEKVGRAIIEMYKQIKESEGEVPF